MRYIPSLATAGARAMQSLGEFEYSQGDILGHGAFAIVFKGRRKMVSKGVLSLC